ncbi:MAG: hypothetical protein ACI9NA_000319 [Gammaproteobacteria bacterium]|jgi:hypothetical protein
MLTRIEQAEASLESLERKIFHKLAKKRWLAAAKFISRSQFMLKNYLEYSNLNVIQENFDLRLLRNEFIGLSAFEIPLISHQASSERNASMAKYLAEKYPEFL